jgi:hypothetical protein
MDSKTSTKGIGKVIFSSSLGTLIEWYDFYIFGMLAKTISTQFFPMEMIPQHCLAHWPFLPQAF